MSATVAIEDFPAEVRADVRDFAQVFVRLIGSREDITSERVGEALASHECVRGGDGFYSSGRQFAVMQVLRERLALTYDEFRSEREVAS